MAEIRKETEEATRIRDTEMAECKRLYPGAKANVKPVTPATKCEIDANVKYAIAIDRSAGNPHLSSFKVLAARKLVAAERYDRGATTEAEYELETASAQAELDASIRKTDNQMAMVAAAQQQADAASSMAVAAVVSSAVPPPQPIQPPPRSVTCRTFGNTTTCN